MHHMKQPGAPAKSNRAGEFVFGETLSHTTAPADLQRHRLAPCRLVGWRVTRWLAVEEVEVSHD